MNQCINLSCGRCSGLMASELDWSRFERWPGSCCVLGQDTFLASEWDEGDYSRKYMYCMYTTF